MIYTYENVKVNFGNCYDTFNADLKNSDLELINKCLTSDSPTTIPNTQYPVGIIANNQLMLAHGNDSDKQLYSWLSKIKQCIEDNKDKFTYPKLDGPFNQNKKNNILRQIANYKENFTFIENGSDTTGPPPNDGISDEYHYIANIIKCIKDKLTALINSFKLKSSFLAYNSAATAITSYSPLTVDDKQKILNAITNCIQEQIDLIINHTTLKTSALNAGPGIPNPVAQLLQFVEQVQNALTEIENKIAEAETAANAAQEEQRKATAAAAAATDAEEAAGGAAATAAAAARAAGEAAAGAAAATKQQSLIVAIRNKDIATRQLTLAQTELTKAQAAEAAAAAAEQAATTAAARAAQAALNPAQTEATDAEEAANNLIRAPSTVLKIGNVPTPFANKQIKDINKNIQEINKIIDSGKATQAVTSATVSLTAINDSLAIITANITAINDSIAQITANITAINDSIAQITSL